MRGSTVQAYMIFNLYYKRQYCGSFSDLHEVSRYTRIDIDDWHEEWESQPDSTVQEYWKYGHWQVHEND